MSTFKLQLLGAIANGHRQTRLVSTLLTQKAQDTLEFFFNRLKQETNFLSFNMMFSEIFLQTSLWFLKQFTQ